MEQCTREIEVISTGQPIRLIIDRDKRCSQLMCQRDNNRVGINPHTEFITPENLYHCYGCKSTFGQS